LFLTARKENYKSGDLILREGTYGVAVYIIESGKVEISKDVQGKKLVIETLGPGDIFGEMSYIDTEPRSATATALEDTVLELVDKDFLDSEFNQLSSDFRVVLRTLVKRLRTTTQKLTGTTGPRHIEERKGAKIRVNFKKTSDFFRAYIGNLARGGLFIKTNQTIPAGSLLNLEFNLPGSEYFIQAKGKVIWVRSQGESDEKKPAGLGIQFTQMSSEDSKRLNNFISTYKF
jgi:uncharacterized protein (TIGR02266 family)